MAESKLREQSMDFAVSIINLVKDLKLKKKILSLIRLAEAEPLLVQIFEKLSMLTEKPILPLNCKLPSKKPMKQDIGLNFCIKQIT